MPDDFHSTADANREFTDLMNSQPLRALWFLAPNPQLDFHS